MALVLNSSHSRGFKSSGRRIEQIRMNPSPSRRNRSPEKLVSILKIPPSEVKVTSISIDDIYGLAERERLKSRESYRDKLMRNKMMSQSLPTSIRDTARRPATQPSSNMEITANTETHSMSAPSRSRICIRAESNLNPIALKDTVNPLSRQCCDVLGPHICHKCSKISERYNDIVKCEEAFPSLRVSEENFSTSVLLTRYIPEMTTHQLQNKVARGEISRVNFRERSSTLLDTKQAYEKDYVPPEIDVTRRRPKTITSDGSTWTYFNSIRDLNNRMIDGKVPKRLPKGQLAMPDDAFSKVKKKIDKRSFSEMLMPMFVSGKKNEKNLRATYIQYFDPPLLSLVAQNAEPAFFAGSSHEYKLPERLPDQLFTEEELTIPVHGGLGDLDDDIVEEEAEVRSQMSQTHDSASHISKTPDHSHLSKTPTPSHLSKTPTPTSQKTLDNVSASPVDEQSKLTPDLTPFNNKFIQKH